MFIVMRRLFSLLSQTYLKILQDGKELNKSINPDKAVACGANVQAAILLFLRSRRTWILHRHSDGVIWEWESIRSYCECFIKIWHQVPRQDATCPPAIVSKMPIKCIKCDLRFIYQELLIEHLKVHDDIMPKRMHCMQEKI